MNGAIRSGSPLPCRSRSAGRHEVRRVKDGGLTGLTIDQQTGAISGTAPQVDKDTDCTVTVKVTYPDGTAEEKAVKVTVKTCRPLLEPMILRISRVRGKAWSDGEGSPDG